LCEKYWKVKTFVKKVLEGKNICEKRYWKVKTFVKKGTGR
jgi:hypothetical protein